MPIGGPVPKPRDQIRHRVPPAFDWVEVPDVPFETGPRMEHRVRLNGLPWPKRALKKWNVWRRMPHCVLWTQQDWEFAIDALEVFAQACDSGGFSPSMSKELRDREKAMATTLDYRRACRIRYVPAGSPTTAPGNAGSVKNIADYRNL